MPPTDPRKPGLVGSQIKPQMPSAMATPRLPLDDSPPPTPRLREVDEMVDAKLSTEVVGRKRQTTCRNTQKIGGTLFKCAETSGHSKSIHREKGRVIKDGKTIQYEVQWWDIPTEVIRAS